MNTSFHEIIPPLLLRNISVLPKQTNRLPLYLSDATNSVIVEMKNPLDKYQEFYTQYFCHE
jgi:hypothetical protein